MRKQSYEEAIKKIVSARSVLIVQQPFFAALCLGLDLVPADNEVPAMATDGEAIFFNTDWIIDTPLPEIQGTVCHEVMHCVLGHIWRRGARDSERWNWAADYVANPYVLEAAKMGGTMRLPPGYLDDPKYHGLPTEIVYDMLKGQPPQTGPGGKGVPGHMIGGMRPPKPGTNPDTLMDKWKVAAMKAAQAAKMHGKLPAGLARLIDEMREPSIDWASQLHCFMQQFSKEETSWAVRSRRHAATDFYLPGKRSMKMGPLVWAYDTSGSIGNSLGAQFGGEIQGGVDAVHPETTTIIYCDAEIPIRSNGKLAVDVFEDGEDIVVDPIGGGGTDFRPVFEYVEEHGIQPACLIYLTDLDGTFPKDAPDYPVLWASIQKKQVPFGEVLLVEEMR